MNDQTDGFLIEPKARKSSIFPALDEELANFWLADNARVEAAQKKCPKVELNVGIFFDGTYNNSYNVDQGLEPETDHTNIWYLYRAHPNENFTYHDCGGVKSAEHRIYVRGIGTSDGVPNSSLGGSTGHGEWGLESRLKKATDELRDIVDLHLGMTNISSITVDLFGFSRGAATARVFANMLTKAADPKVKLRFMGLFDTVGSFGIAGNSTEMSTEGELRPLTCAALVVFSPVSGFRCLQLPKPKIIDLAIRADSAQIVYHITAEDEFRYFFPLTRALPGHATEVSMPGAHADVGGGYTRDYVTEEFSHKSPVLEKAGCFDEAVTVQRPGSMREGTINMVYIRNVWGGLSDAALIAMLAHAKRAGVPIDDIIIEHRDDIAALARHLIDGSTIDPRLARRIRTRYVHRSFGGGFSGMSFGSTRETFPNPR